MPLWVYEHACHVRGGDIFSGQQSTHHMTIVYAALWKLLASVERKCFSTASKLAMIVLCTAVPHIDGLAAS